MWPSPLDFPPHLDLGPRTLDRSLDELLGSDSDRSVGVPRHEHRAPSYSPIDFLQPLNIRPQTSDHSIDKLLGPDSDCSMEALPHVRGAPSPSLLDPPPSSANVTPRPQEEGPSHPNINEQWVQEELSLYYREPAKSHRKATEVLVILQKTTGDRECRDQLAWLLTHDCLDLIRVLLKNRHGGTSNKPPLTPEDNSSLDDTRDRAQEPLDMSIKRGALVRAHLSV